MTVQEFIHRHYSAAVGESPVGHAIVTLTGLALIAIGSALIMSVVFLAEGVAVGMFGLLLLGAGLFAHIVSPLAVSDILDMMLGLSAPAIALTLVIVIIANAVGFTWTVIVLLFQWLLG